MTTTTYEVWLEWVREALKSINMSMDDWQPLCRFDFPGEHDKGADPDAAAMKANRFWWYQQNRSTGRDCDARRVDVVHRAERDDNRRIVYAVLDNEPSCA